MTKWLGIAALAAVLAACNSNSGGSGADGKYAQTWRTPYGSTTCGQFENAMSPHQRFAAAADMVTGARNKGDGGTGVPTDSLIDRYKVAVDAVCAADPSSSLADAGVSAYLSNRAAFRP